MLRKLIKLFLKMIGRDTDSLEKRVQRTVSCRDSDYIPKVDRAGEVFDEGGTPYQLMHNGVKVELGGYHGNWMTEIIRSLKGHHEPQEEKVFFELLKRLQGSPVMLELGSYWSYYSMWFHKDFPGGKNIMVEPIKEKFELGKRNFELNGFDGTFIRGAVGGQYDPAFTFTDWNGDLVKVPQYSVDCLLQHNDIDFLHVLHSDIQGAELDMLKGCREALIQKRIGYFCISTHGKMHGQCLQFFEAENMHIIAEHSPEESASADGLIVAQSDAVPFIAEVQISK